MGYRDPSQYFTTTNAQIAAQTAAANRSNSARTREAFAAMKKDRIAKLEKKEMERKAKVADASSAFDKEYREAKNASAKFASRVGNRTEGSHMNEQISNALVQIGEELNAAIANNEDMSQFKIDQLTSDAVVKVQRLKEDLTTLYAGYEEYLAQMDLDDTDANKILKSVNPELQNLYEGLADDKLDVILNMDPNTGNWLFLPVEKGKDTFKKLKAGMKIVDGEIKNSEGKEVQAADAYEEVDYEQAKTLLETNPQSLSYNVFNDAGIVDGTNLTAMGKDGKMFETVPDDIDTTVSNLHEQIMQLYQGGMFQSIDETGGPKGRVAPMSKNKRQQMIEEGRKVNTFLDQEAAFNYFTQDPEGKALLNTFIDQENKSGLAQGLGTNLTGLEATLMRSALLKAPAPQTGMSATDQPLDTNPSVNTMQNQ
jgi:hypothetical protein